MRRGALRGYRRTPFGVVPFTVRYVTNPLIGIDGDFARGHWHALVTMTVPGGQAVWSPAMYTEDDVRTSEDWKFKMMRFDADASPPNEAGWGKIQNQSTSDAFADGKFRRFRARDGA